MGAPAATAVTSASANRNCGDFWEESMHYTSVLISMATPALEFGTFPFCLLCPAFAFAFGAAPYFQCIALRFGSFFCWRRLNFYDQLIALPDVATIRHDRNCDRIRD